MRACILFMCVCVFFFADTMLQYQHFHVLMMWELEFPDTTWLTLFRLNFPFCMYEWTHFAISTKLNKNQVIVSLCKKKTQRDYNEKEKEWEKLKTKKRPSEMKTRISMKLNEKLKANNEQWTKICLLKHKIFV